MKCIDAAVEIFKAVIRDGRCDFHLQGASRNTTGTLLSVLAKYERMKLTSVYDAESDVLSVMLVRKY